MLCTFCLGNKNIAIKESMNLLFISPFHNTDYCLLVYTYFSNEKLVRYSLFDIHFSEISSFFVICYSTFIFQKLVRYSTFIFQKLVRFSLFVIRHSFFRSKFVFRYLLFDIRTLTFFQVIMLINLV